MRKVRVHEFIMNIQISKFSVFDQSISSLLYQNRSTVRASDIELAKAELAKLEHRFHLRVEQNQLQPSANASVGENDKESAASRIGIGLIPINQTPYSLGSSFTSDAGLVYNAAAPSNWVNNYSNSGQSTINSNGSSVPSIVLPSQVAFVQGTNMQASSSCTANNTAPAQWNLISVPGAPSFATNIIFSPNQTNIKQMSVK